MHQVTPAEGAAASACVQLMRFGPSQSVKKGEICA